jgi:hypothetical protein
MVSLRQQLEKLDQSNIYYGLQVTVGVLSFAGMVQAAAGMCVLSPSINWLAAGVFFIEMALSIVCWSIAAALGMGPGSAVMVAVSVTALANTALSLIAARKTAEEVDSGEFGTGAYEPAYEPTAEEVATGYFGTGAYKPAYEPTPRQPRPPSKAFPAAALPQGGA